MPRKIRDYKDEYQKYQGSDKQKKNRAKRNKARAMLEVEGLVKKHDGKDIDHKKALSKRGSNSRANLQVISQSSNRSYKRNKKGGIA